MIGNTFFLSFILVYFNYFKLKKTSQNKGKSLISESVTQLQKRVTTFTYILSRDIALQIMKKERCLLSNALFHSANVYCFTNRSFYDLRLSDAVNKCICTG